MDLHLHREKKNSLINLNNNPDIVLFLKMRTLSLTEARNLFMFTVLVPDSVLESNFPLILALTALLVISPFSEIKSLKLERLTDLFKITPLTYYRGRIGTRIINTTVCFLLSCFYTAYPFPMPWISHSPNENGILGIVSWNQWS